MMPHFGVLVHKIVSHMDSHFQSMMPQFGVSFHEIVSHILRNMVCHDIMTCSMRGTHEAPICTQGWEINKIFIGLGIMPPEGLSQKYPQFSSESVRSLNIALAPVIVPLAILFMLGSSSLLHLNI